MSTQEVEAPAAKRPPATVETIELGSQKRSVHGKLPELTRILETYAEKLRIMVSKLVWQPAPVTFGPIEVLNDKELETKVRTWPTGAHIMWPQVGTVGYIGMNFRMCASLIELAYGTPANRLAADTGNIHQRLTEVDRRTLEPTFLRLARTLSAALAPGDTPPTSVEMLAAPFQLAMPRATESALMCTLEFPLSGQQGSVTMVLFSPVLEHLHSTASATQQSTQADLSEHIKTTHVDMVTILGTTHLLVSELAALAVGDHLWLDRSTNEDLPVFIENEVKFLARPRQHNGTLGLQIVGRVS